MAIYFLCQLRFAHRHILISINMATCIVPLVGKSLSPFFFSFFIFKSLPDTRNNSCIVGVVTNTGNSHTQTARPGTNLYTIQMFVPCGDRIRDTQRSSRSLRHCANCVVNKSALVACASTHLPFRMVVSKYLRKKIIS